MARCSNDDHLILHIGDNVQLRVTGFAFDETNIQLIAFDGCNNLLSITNRNLQVHLRILPGEIGQFAR
ncbi:hypothetical protein D3C80_2085730 [compost metagenome]